MLTGRARDTAGRPLGRRRVAYRAALTCTVRTVSSTLTPVWSAGQFPALWYRRSSRSKTRVAKAIQMRPTLGAR